MRFGVIPALLDIIRGGSKSSVHTRNHLESRTAAIGALQSLCYHPEGRHALRLAASTNDSDNDEDALTGALRVLAAVLQPAPYSAEDTVFRPQRQQQCRDGVESSVRSRREGARQLASRLQLLQRTLGSLHNMSSDPLVAETMAKIVSELSFFVRWSLLQPSPSERLTR